MLLEQGSATINAPCSKGLTPLHLAVCTGDCGIVKLLLRHGANVNAADGANRTPMDCAVTVKDCPAAIVELLLTPM
jgi:ankyrin repeat protein